MIISGEASSIKEKCLEILGVVDGALCWGTTFRVDLTLFDEKLFELPRNKVMLNVKEEALSIDKVQITQDQMSIITRLQSDLVQEFKYSIDGTLVIDQYSSYRYRKRA